MQLSSQAHGPFMSRAPSSGRAPIARTQARGAAPRPSARRATAARAAPAGQPDHDTQPADGPNSCGPAQGAASTSGRGASGPRGAAGPGGAASAPGGGRRRLLLRAAAAPLLVQMAIGSDDATTIINSVLSGYGLPTLKATPGYKAWDEFADEFTFEYPKAWVSRPNSLRKGVYISDFQTADKITVEVLDAPKDGDVQAATVTASVLPGNGRLTQDDILSLPPASQVKAASAVIDGQEILYLEFPSETITRSGYQIKRVNFAAAAVKRGKLYTITASARGDQYNAAKRETLQHVVRSFRVR